MPELLSIHGRCPRCSQVLTVPAGQLQSVFRCARCQYRVPGAVLIDEAKSSPPRVSASPVLGPFDEDPDDQHTRMHLPGAGGDEESEVPMAAVLVNHTVSSSPPGGPALQRFETDADDAEDQQTRLHVAGSFDAPSPPPRAPSRAPLPRVPSPRPPPPGAPVRDATLLGMPAAPALTRFEGPDEAGDEATRMHLVEEGGSYPGAAPGVEREPTLMGVPPGMASGAPALPLSRFEQAGDDSEDQHTRLQVPISYEAHGENRPPPARELRPLVVTRPRPGEALDLSALTGGDRFGRATLQLSHSLDEWLRERRLALLITLAVLNAIIAPGFDVLLSSTRQGATVIAANLTLFFLWALGVAWLGRLRNDAGVWDYRVALTRINTSVRLTLADLASFGKLPRLLRWRVIGEVSGALGLLGLGLAGALTISHLVWAWPTSAPVLIWRAFCGVLVVLSLVALREAASVPLTQGASPEITAPAVALFPAVVDLSLPLASPAANGHSLLHQVLRALAEWQPREWSNQDSYLMVLERHLLRHAESLHVERESWLGEQRSEGIAHLIIGEGLLIEVMHGFDLEAAERVAAKMRLYAKIWRGKPALIVVFDASRAELTSGPGTELLEGLHRSYPILTVRMPSASLAAM